MTRGPLAKDVCGGLPACHVYAGSCLLALGLQCEKKQLGTLCAWVERAGSSTLPLTGCTDCRMGTAVTTAHS